MPYSKPLERSYSPRKVILASGQILFVGALLFALSQYQFFLDEYALQTYHPNSEVAALIAPLKLTRSGRAILYRSNPVIDDKTHFNSDCKTSKGELELGCYTNNQIFILRIENVRLKPEMQTVLAHELLHAAWSRLSGSDQTKLGRELESTYHGLSDQELTARIAGYAISEPGEETNELHSILGTELANLTDSDLQRHFSDYFLDRQSIVNAHAQYEAVFTTQRTFLNAELGTIKSLKSQLTTLNARMNALKASGQISSYNALVPMQNRLVDQLNNLIKSYNKDVDDYNALSASIDSNQITTEPSV
jgi:hypothetical protein